MKRLFFAIKFDEPFLKEIVNYQARLKTNYLRLVPKDNLHLTLLFLGETEDYNLDKIDQTIQSEVIPKVNYQNIYLRLKRIEYGPNPLRPRLIWITGEKNEDLFQLHQLLRNSLKSFHKKEDQFDFVPHITIARFNQSINKEHLITLPQPQIFENKIIEINNFWLMESKLSFQEGAQYFNLKEYHF